MTPESSAAPAPSDAGPGPGPELGPGPGPGPEHLADGDRAAPDGIQLVVTDLDGTLWDADERIHHRTLAALESLREAAVPLLVATGRRLRSARTRLRADGIELPIVALDGALGRDGDRTFHHRTFAPGPAERVIAAFADIGVSPCVYVDEDDVDMVLGDAPSTHPAHLEMIGDGSRTAELGRVVREAGVHAVGVYGVAGAAGERLAGLVDALGGLVEHQGGPDPYFGGHSLVVYPRGTTKWAGVRSFCADRGLDERAVLALGDGPNDVELLAHARVACVVADGADVALDLADLVIDPASAGGWAQVLELVDLAGVT